MKKHAYQFAYIVIGVIVVIAMTLFARSKINTKPDISIHFENFINRDEFTEFNATDIKADSFMVLAQKAYGSLLQASKQGGILSMKLDNTNKLGSDFYNNNDKLLGYQKDDFGFDIKNDAKSGTVNATFVISEGTFVTVPNDVLIKMMYKAYNK